MYGYNAMEVQEAFNKICEQASLVQSCYLMCHFGKG